METNTWEKIIQYTLTFLGGTTKEFKKLESDLTWVYFPIVYNFELIDIAITIREAIKGEFNPIQGVMAIDALIRTGHIVYDLIDRYKQESSFVYKENYDPDPKFQYPGIIGTAREIVQYFKQNKTNN